MLARKARKNRSIKVASFAAGGFVGVPFLLMGLVASASAQTALVTSGERASSTPSQSPTSNPLRSDLLSSNLRKHRGTARMTIGAARMSSLEALAEPTAPLTQTMLSSSVSTGSPHPSPTVSPSPVPSAATSPQPTATPATPVTVSGALLATQTYTTHVNATGNSGNAGGGDQPSRFNIGSAFLTIARNSGFFRYGASAGLYSIPVVGVSGNKTLEANVNTNTYGPVPSAYVSLNPNDHVSISVGKLATLIGQENTYTYLNPNIQRGLVWNMETAVSRGVRLTMTAAKYTGALEVNDGFYSGHFFGVEGSVALAADTNTSYQFVFVAPNSNAPGNPTSSIANKRLYNFMYTATRGPWTWAPYLLFVQSPSSSTLGYSASESAYGLVLISTYRVNPTWSVTGRIEDIANWSAMNDPSPNADLVGYGPGSGAWSFTLTPAYRRKQLLVRADLSDVSVRSAALGSAFGNAGSQRNQFRFVLESGVQF